MNSEIQQEKSIEKKNYIKNIRFILLGYTVVAVGLCCTMLVRGIYPIWIGELVAIAIGIAGWVLGFIGAGKTKNYNKYFKIIRIIAIVGAASKAIEGILGYRNYILGCGDLSFVEIEASFFGYVSIIALLVGYGSLSLGIKKLNDVDKKDKSVANIRTLVIVMMVALIVGPMGSIFPMIIEIIIIAASVGAIMTVVIITDTSLVKLYKKGSK